MRPAISIVVPIYNMEKYVARCLESLLLQTFRDMEIVAVNDGSRDASGAILRRYAEADSRLVVIERENGGVSSARNAGVRAARGRYIGFADPDDWVDPEMYGALYREAVQEDADIVMCGYTREFGTRSAEKTFPLPDKTVARGREAQRFWTRRLIGPIREELAQPDYLDAWGTVWSKLYRASMIRDDELRFADLDEIGSCEDTLFNIEAFRRAGSVVFLNRPYYHYWRANADSVTTRYKSRLPDQFEALYKRMEELADQCDAELAGAGTAGEHRLALSNRVCMNVVGLGLNIVGRSHAASVADKLRLLRKLVRGERLNAALGRLEYRYCPTYWRLFFLCARLKLPVALYVLLAAIERLRTRARGGAASGTGKNLAGRDRHEPRRPGNDADELLSADGSRSHSI